MRRPKIVNSCAAVMLLSLSLPAAAQLQSTQSPTLARPTALPAPNNFIQGRLTTVGLRAGEAGCSQPLNALGVDVVEYFYVQSTGGLQIPSSRSPGGGGYTFDRLVSGNTPLQQGRVLGSSAVAADGTFRIGWSEPLILATTAPKRPWIENVQHYGAAGMRLVTAYRVLELRLKVLSTPPPGQIWSTQFAPEPRVLFYGSETTKDVGVIRAICEGFSF